MIYSRLKKETQESRLGYWKDFFSTVTKDDAWTAYYKVIKSRNRTGLPEELRVNDNQIIKGEQAMTEYFTEHFFGQPLTGETGEACRHLLAAIGQDDIYTPEPAHLFTVDEVTWAIETFGNR